jgi:hypothetical protein
LLLFCSFPRLFLIANPLFFISFQYLGQALISQCWAMRPESRPTIDQAAEHLKTLLSQENPEEPTQPGPEYQSNLESRMPGPSYRLDSGSD